MDISIPPCQAACPIRTDVRGYVQAIAEGDVDKALEIIRKVNPFPGVCGRICTRPCESNCRRREVDEAVSIRQLKRYAADKAKSVGHDEKPEKIYDERIAVIGGGPSGLTAAHDLALLGYEVTIFDSQNVLGGMLSEGIPEYRLPRKVVEDEVDNILSLGVEARKGVSLGRDFTIEDLLKDYSVVFLAIGSQRSLVPHVPGSDLEGIIPAVEFLKKIDRGGSPVIGHHVTVIGGGHTAIDAARTCVRLGDGDVTILYRRSLEEMPAGKEEVEEAEKEGIRVMYLTSPVDFLGDGHVQKVRCVRMGLGERDKSGRRCPMPIEKSEFEIETDMVISAIGYTPDKEMLKHTSLEMHKNGTVIVKDETGVTNMPCVYAAGDVVSGPLSVVEAIASGRRVAEAIHRFLRKKPDVPEQEMIVLDPLNPGIAERIKEEPKRKTDLLPTAKRRGNFDEVDLGYSRESAAREAMRCLHCGAGASVEETCAACMNCVRVCPYGVPAVGKEIADLDISQCQACGICAAECPAGAIKLRFENPEESYAELEKMMIAAREEVPEILIIGFYCQYSQPIGPPVDVEPIYWMSKFCTGRLSEKQILDPFDMGADGVVIHVCDDQQCRFQNGQFWLKKHAHRAVRMLDDIGINGSRLAILSGEDDLRDFVASIRTIGINPIRSGKKVRA